MALTRDAMGRYAHLYHGTSLSSGRAILRKGIRIPTASRWFAGEDPVSLEHGFRFYTCVDVAGSRPFARQGMILRFTAPFPPGILGKIDPGPGGGHDQISFGPEALGELRQQLTHYSIDDGSTWIPIHVQDTGLQRSSSA